MKTLVHPNIVHRRKKMLEAGRCVLSKGVKGDDSDYISRLFSVLYAGGRSSAPIGAEALAAEEGTASKTRTNEMNSNEGGGSSSRSTKEDAAGERVDNRPLSELLGRCRWCPGNSALVCLVCKGEEKVDFDRNEGEATSEEGTAANSNAMQRKTLRRTNGNEKKSANSNKSNNNNALKGNGGGLPSSAGRPPCHRPFRSHSPSSKLGKATICPFCNGSGSHARCPDCDILEFVECTLREGSETAGGQAMKEKKLRENSVKDEGVRGRVLAKKAKEVYIDAFTTIDAAVV